MQNSLIIKDAHNEVSKVEAFAFQVVDEKKLELSLECPADAE
jgi:enamine deaminase RidA (YjgF/YER057c/UK114 family)